MDEGGVEGGGFVGEVVALLRELKALDRPAYESAARDLRYRVRRARLRDGLRDK